ncbi:MAG TPA: RNA polymerase sporulation sigma factor SigF [Spirochaetia bacterium]|nr:RNA polymerase sporulation sigma factor SigF [Spirochaetia bacterium]
MATKLAAMNLPRYPLLDEAQTRSLIQRAQDGDQLARERLINCNLKLVFNLVKRFWNRGYEQEDLFQVGCIGLMKAVDKFNLNFQVKFSTYAVPMIIGEIRRFLRDDGAIKVSRTIKETAARVNVTREQMLSRLGRDPTAAEIATALAISPEDVVLALEAVQTPVSVYEAIHSEDGDPVYILDQLRGEERESSWLETIALAELLQELPERDRLILRARFFEDRTQAEVAARLGLSQVQVSRLERQALGKLREVLGERPSG